MEENPGHPRISPKSYEIVMKKSTLENPLGIYGENTFNFNLQHWKEENRKIMETRSLMKEEQEMKEFTGKPAINKSSREMKRNVNDLYQWKTKQVKQLEAEKERVWEAEQKRLEELQKKKMVSKRSESLARNKNGTLNVQERLLRDANLRKNKQGQNVSHMPTLSPQKFASSLRKSSPSPVNKHQISQQKLHLQLDYNSHRDGLISTPLSYYTLNSDSAPTQS